MSPLRWGRAARSAAAALAVLGLSSPAFGSSAPPLSFEQRLARADRAVLGTVVSQRIEALEGDVRRPLTVTTVQVQEHLKGSPEPQVLEVVQLGGRSGGWSLAVPGDAKLGPGERVVLLLRCGASAPAETSQAVPRCTLFGLADGKLATRVGVGGEVEVLIPTAGPERGLEVRPLAKLRALTRSATAPLTRPAPVPERASSSSGEKKPAPAPRAPAPAGQQVIR